MLDFLRFSSSDLKLVVSSLKMFFFLSDLSFRFRQNLTFRTYLSNFRANMVSPNNEQPRGAGTDDDDETAELYTKARTMTAKQLSCMHRRRASKGDDEFDEGKPEVSLGARRQDDDNEQLSCMQTTMTKVVSCFVNRNVLLVFMKLSSLFWADAEL